MPAVNIEAAELKQLQKENRILKKKLQRAQKDLKSSEATAKTREHLHRQVILELQESRQVLEAKKNDLQILLKELSEAQNKLIEAEKQSALGQLVAGVAHEINTPVGTSITLASTLMHELESFKVLTNSGALKRSQLKKYIENTQESTELILHNLKRAGDLVKTFKQVAVDQSVHEHRPFEVTSYLQEVGKSLKTHIKKQGHHFSISGPEIYIDGYPGLFAQIVTNFVMNSLNHAFTDGKQGEISLDILLQDDQMTLTYRDNGCGIPEDLWSKVYEPFYTTSRNTGGTGLGLHIVYNIVTQKLKGDIQLSSTLGQGTQFIITVPVILVNPAAFCSIKPPYSM